MQRQQARFDCQIGAGIAVISAHGEIDALTAPDLAARFDEVAASEARAVAVSLVDLTYLDSAALTVLVKARRTLRERGKPLFVAVSNAHIRRVFEITHLYRSLNCYDELADALDAARAAVSSA